MRIIELPVLPRIAFLCLIMVAGLFCGPTSVSAQVKDSYTQTINWGGGEKHIITETQFENGDVTIQTRFVNAKGMPERESSVTKKSDGETVTEDVVYDSKGQIDHRYQTRTENGKFTYQLNETYENGELHTGESFYYDAAGNITSHRRYNPATQTYEEAELRPTEVSKTPAQKTPTKAAADTKSGSVPPVQEEQNGQSEASKKFRQNVPYGQPAQQTPPMMMPPGMRGYGTGTDDAQKRDETPPVIIPPYGYGTGGYDAPQSPWPGGPGPWPAPPP
jgi:hypothetical protein